MKTVSAVLLASLFAFPFVAGSANAAETPSVTGQAPVVEVSGNTPAGVTADPNIDRGFIMPTAMTQPAGSMTYNNYELLLHGFTYGVTDRVQVTATVVSPIVKDMPFFGIAAVKGRLVALPRFSLALQGSAGFGHIFTDFESTNNNLGTLGIGGVASACLSEDCASLLSASATYSLAFSEGRDAHAQFLLYGASIVGRVSPHVKLLGELTSAAANESNGTGFTNAKDMLVSYGVRLHTANIAGDIGFMKPVGEDTGDFLLGLPFVNFSYRWE